MRLNNIIKIAFLGLSLSFVSVFTGSLATGTIISSAHAAVVSNIDVRGNQRIDDEIVASYLTIKPGQNFNDFDIDDSVKALFATGLFGDVSIFRQGSTLVVDVEENGTVNKVFFEGNSRLKDDVLKNVARLRPQGIYSDEQAAADAEQIKQAYARVGRQDAEVSYEVLPLANNRLNVIYRVNEGDKTKIGSIDFIGNDTFSGRRLADVITTKETGLFGFLQTSDVYDQSRLNSDEELLRRFYFNQGFADFQIISTQAILDDVENEYVVTITMDEGPRYTFGNVAIESSLSGVENIALDNLVETRTGDKYNAKNVEDTVVAITERVAEEGFAFVEVVPRGNRNFETNTIDVTYLIDEGARVFIEDIRIIGNDRTRDYVIRREFEISEGDAYNRVLVQKTRDRINGLGFFDSVNVSTRPGSEPDRIILFVNVMEKSTGDFSLSGGFSSNGGASGEVSFTERNFLGRGQFIRASYRGSADENQYAFNFTEPYFLGSRVSAGFGIQSVRSEDTDERQYSVDTDSATITFGLPLTENLRSSVFYTYQSSNTSVGDSLLDPVVPATAPAPAAPLDQIQGNRFGELSNALVNSIDANGGDFVSSGVGYSFIYNTFDNQQAPREGIRAAWTQTYFGLGGDGNYLLTEASLAGYQTISEEQDIVLFGRLRGGHVEVIGDDDNTGFRTLDNFQARQNYVRGFDSFGFGPRDPFTDDPLGGRTYWTATAEVIFPLPFVSRSLGLRGAFFADAGQLSNVGQPALNAIVASNGALDAAQLNQADSDGIRASVGGSILWASPFGPLRVDYAVPINEESFDNLEEISFGVSTAF